MGYFKLLWDFFILRSNTKKSRNNIQKMQDKKLRKLLKYAYENSPYYHSSFEKAGITRDSLNTCLMSSLPTIDKELLMKHFDELVTTKDLQQENLRMFDEETKEHTILYRNKYHVVHSSGSTGKPGYFVYDEEAWRKMTVAIIRGALWNMTMREILMVLVRGPRILYIAATDGRYGGAMAVGDGIEGLHAKQLSLDIKTPLFEWIEKIKRFKPNIIIGYPSAIKILADLVEKGEVQVNITRVIFCGEPLDSGLRKYMEDTFQAKVINFYGSSESLALGVEDSSLDGMYLFDDMNYIEVEDGTMYITSLYNYVQPLIRYKISDQLVLKEVGENHSCPFMQAEILRGRQEDLLWFEDGEGNKDFLHPLAVEGFCMEGLLDYQFCQIEVDTFEMLVEISDVSRENDIREELMRQMEQILKEKQLEYIQFYVRFVEKILPDPKTGKKKLVLSNEMRDLDEKNYTFRKRCL